MYTGGVGGGCFVCFVVVLGGGGGGGGVLGFLTKSTDQFLWSLTSNQHPSLPSQLQPCNRQA